jgi:hypothetical protein
MRQDSKMVSKVCEKEAVVFAATQSGEMSPELIAHLSVCPICNDAHLVGSFWILAGQQAGANQPDRELIYRMALQREERVARARALRPRLFGDRIQVAIAAVAVIAAIVAGAQAPGALSLLLPAGAILLALVAALLCLLPLKRA